MIYHETKKKKMKLRTKIIWGIILFLLLKLIYSIVSPFFIIPNEIKELNENTNIPFEFTNTMDSYLLDLEEWEREEDYCSIIFRNNNGDRLEFCGYPDLSNKFKLTYFGTVNSERMIYGIKVGDDMKEVKKKLQKNGFKEIERFSDYGDYIKGRVTIGINIKSIYYGTDTADYEDEIVEAIKVSIYSTDWLHRGYYK